MTRYVEAVIAWRPRMDCGSRTWRLLPPVVQPSLLQACFDYEAERTRLLWLTELVGGVFRRRWDDQWRTR